MEQHSMHWAEAWLRTSSHRLQPGLRRLLGHRQPANIISEEAVLIGVTAMRANRAIRPNPCFKPFAGFGFVGEDRVLKVRGHGNQPF